MSNKIFLITSLIILTFLSTNNGRETTSRQPLSNIYNIDTTINRNLIDNKEPGDTQIISRLPVRCVGPTGMIANGRISDIAVYEKNPNIFYVSTASGGVFKTVDGGNVFEIFYDREGGSSIGATALCQTNPNIFWVGAGEGWQRNTAGWGKGIYKTEDAGKTWRNMGLTNSNSFGKIIINPNNADIVYAAVLGSMWGYGPDRGVYKTNDGGKTWKKVLYVDEKTGAADLAIDPINPQNIIASMWDHQRLPYFFRPGGRGSGIYRSSDGGETWQKAKGLPEVAGRISLDYFRKDPRYAAAVVDQFPAAAMYKSMDGGSNWTKMPSLHEHGGKLTTPEKGDWGRPFYDFLTRYDPVDSNKIYHGSLEHYTTDGGRTFIGSNSENHALWIDPNDPKHFIEGGDGGLEIIWKPLTPDQQRVTKHCELPPYAQAYGIGYDMRRLYWLATSPQDQSGNYFPTQTRVGAVTGFHVQELSNVSEGGTCKIDPQDWTTVYGGGRGTLLGRWDMKTGEKIDIGPFPYKKDSHLRSSWFSRFIISPWNSKTLYFGGNQLYKSSDRGDTWKIISPDLTHNKPEWAVDTFLTEEGKWGTNVADMYQCITAISESQLKQGMLWVGTDDGLMHLTMDDGKSWINLTKNIQGLPQYTWCSSIIASKHKEGRAYATFDGHRNFDLKPYIYVTEDYGKTWIKLSTPLGENESCYTIVEGQKNPDLLFVGTEFGLWISLDRGKTWNRYQDFESGGDNYGELWHVPNELGYISKTTYFPTVAVHDLQIQPRELDLIISTHGRSVWIMPIRALEELTKENRKKDLYFCTPGNVYLFPTESYNAYSSDVKGYRSVNTQPGTLFTYFLRKAGSADATITFRDSTGKEIISEKRLWSKQLKITKPKIKGTARAGLNSIFWRNEGFFTKPGNYQVVLTIDGKEYYQTLHVEDVTEEVLPGYNSSSAKGSKRNQQSTNKKN